MSRGEVEDGSGWGGLVESRTEREARRAHRAEMLKHYASGLEHGRKDERSKFAALLPGPYYMDPPDGGDVTILEQLKRIAEDAARYRWIRSRKGLVLQSDCGIWTRPDGTQFSASHYLAEGGTQHTPEESLDETINAAMRINP